ncbi:MAG: hypothetical protein ACW98K_05265 [Candidatus Kariarchaeaceae archaeon]
MIKLQFLEEEEYHKAIQRRNRIRYLTILIYFVATITSIAIPHNFSWNEQSATIFILTTLILGSITLFTVLLYPYKYKMYSPGINNLQADEALKESKMINSSYYKEVKLKVLYYIIIPMSVGYTFVIPLLYATEGPNSAFLGVLVVLFFMSILLLFDRVTILLEGNMITLKLGSLKDSFQVEDIERIEIIKVRPLRDFLGFGKRLGPDGSIGYIAGGSKGVKFLLKQSKIFVVSTPNPQELADLIHQMKLTINI